MIQHNQEHIDWAKIETALADSSTLQELSREEKELYEQLLATGQNKKLAHVIEHIDTDAAWQKVSGETGITQEKTAVLKTMKRRRIVWFSAAAAFVALLGTAAWFLIQSSPETAENKISPSASKGIQPGGNKATLTLADGSVIVLDNAKTGMLTQQGNVQIQKLADGELAYQPVGERSSVLLYNTVSTPRGGQYQVNLPDGSKVWLNAASSLRFPSAFTEKERRVELTGEAYFEIAALAKKDGPGKVPFIVAVDGKQEVEVLGTQFNVMAYHDESSVNTTLIEGSVKVSSPQTNFSKMIAPGQQVQLNQQGRLVVNKNADLEDVLAWRKGRFHFEGADIEQVMRQIARWYDVEVVFHGKPKKLFHGGISRNVDVSKVFKMLENTGAVQFRIEGRKIIVMP